MPDISEDAIRDALSQVQDPAGGDIVSSGRVEGVIVRDGNVGITLKVAEGEAEALTALRTEAEAAMRGVSGVLSATCVLTSHSEGETEEAARRAPDRSIPEVFDRIGAVVAVASGKGGVGKSTIAVNLALALQAGGKRVGLLDADIYGPSAPQLLDIRDKPDLTDDKKLIPIEKYGLHTMSIGYMVAPEQAMVWRGPMVQSALIQMCEEVAWPELDILVLDLPPGTGDIQLTMAQRIPVAGALVVSLPDKLSLADVRRALAMFMRVEIPVLGVVENMCGLTTPDGQVVYPFGQLGEAAMREAVAADYLGAIPLDPAVQTANESGVPVAIADPNAPLAAVFADLAARIADRLNDSEN